MGAERSSPADDDAQDLAHELADRVRSGDLRAGARLMRLIDDGVPLGMRALPLIYRHGDGPSLYGITGAAGTGKSTLVDRLIQLWRREGKRVGVVAIDPSSPISGGAVLADRARMSSHALDEGVFIRSLASRGHPGGLSMTTSATVRVLEALGFDPVLVETVGVGQSEVDVARLAETVALVLAPGLGDDVQAMKAGLLEVPDVFVVNKADREGADLVVKDVEAMLRMSGADRADGWRPPVLKTIATTGESIEALAQALEEHRAQLLDGGGLVARRLARARLELETALQRSVHLRALERIGGAAFLDAAAARVASGASDPYSEVEAVLAATDG